MFEPPANPPKTPVPDELYVCALVAEAKAAEALRRELENEINALRVLIRSSQVEVGDVCRRLRAWGYSRRQIAGMVGNRNPQYDEQVAEEARYQRFKRRIATTGDNPT